MHSAAAVVAGGAQLAMRLASRAAEHQQFLLVAESDTIFVSWVKVLSIAMREWEKAA